ncbi:MAG TPA: M48 family metallopeptidase [Cyclobacteriaceae bacterium]
MQSEVILTILLVIISVDFILDRVVVYLEVKSSKNPIPKALEGIYDEEKYQKSQEYNRIRARFDNLTSTISFLATFLILWFGAFGWLDQQLRPFAANEIVLSLLFFGVIFLVSDVLSTPFAVYSTFVIEEKFGFNKTTVKTFILDKLKGYLLTIIIGGILIGTLLLLIYTMGSDFWVYFWIVAASFIIFMNAFYTTWIVPLFNKLKPIEDGELKSSIFKYAEKVRFPLKNIFVIDGSKRSSKANAFFSGLGKNKKVVLYDTLIKNHSVDELTAVFAHEVGHYKRKHIVWSLILSVLQVGFMLYLLSLMVFNPQVSYAMGGSVSVMHLNIIAFGILFSPVSEVTGILTNMFSRKNEYEADEYAVKSFKKEPLQEALKKLSANHLSNLTPHPLNVFLNYSHPTLLQRVLAMEKASKR